VPPDERADTATAIFAGHVVAVTPFLGLARQERWRVDDHSLARSFGRWTARLHLADPIYPGRGGGTTTGNLGVWAPGENGPVRLGALPTATLSEIMRAVDLLVSTSGFAVMTEDTDTSDETHLRRLAETPLGAMAEIRKQALERMLRGLDGVQFDARHLRLGPYAIHLATGRVTRDGDPVAVDSPKDTNRTRGLGSPMTKSCWRGSIGRRSRSRSSSPPLEIDARVLEASDELQSAARQGRAVSRSV
jgi:hypothetical protein